ncbi:MAG: hypothetical protein CVT84_08175 [Alphaproteobacteria bacterium HGW-Alphaproteobacteria-6]|nr:MAG: hypothetical protein CVT84_08175 [Alphaproteobacteria bacterium HGW-Alphaproteobacteria-6]
MKNPLFKRIELWLVLVFGLLGLLGAMALGTAALDTERGNSRFGALGRFAHMLADAPFILRDALRADTRMVGFRPERFTDRPTGWTITPGVAPPEGYVLESHYDGDRRRPVIELYSFAEGRVVHEWLPDAGELLADAEVNHPAASPENWTQRYFRAIAPILTEDGRLIIKDHYAPLIGLDACGARLWVQDEMLFHHSTETDGAGGFWIPGVMTKGAVPATAADFVEDAIVHVGANGEILWRRSLPDLLLDHGLDHLLFSGQDYDEDVLHLNDIQPVLTDGRFWQAGDLFLSLRNHSMVMLYRPATDAIVWMQEGPWLNQHDVDILDDHRIAVFDNRLYDKGRGPRIDGSNQIAILDFDTGSVSRPLSERLAELDVTTLFEGKLDLMDDGRVLIEEEMAGRILILDPDGTLVAEYLNKAEDGTPYRMGWSRFMSRAAGDRALAALKAAGCPPG